MINFYSHGKQKITILVVCLFVSIFSFSQFKGIKVDSNGNVGVGTNTPNTRLHIFSGVTNDSGLRLENLISSSPVTTNATPIGVDANGKVVTVAGSNNSGTSSTLISTDGALRITHPSGASFASQTSPITGTIKITLPQTWTNTMMRMTLKVYNYNTNSSFDVHFGGYNHTSGWVNTFAYITGMSQTDRNFNVRFGHDGTKCAIYIGEATSTWQYPQITLTDFEAGYSNYEASKWSSGWVIGFEADAAKLPTSVVSNTQISNWARNGTNTYFNLGNVGIGTTNPISKLSMYGSITINSGLNNTSERPKISSGILTTGELRSFSSHGNAMDDGFIRLSAGGGTNSVKSFIDLSGFSIVPDMNQNIIMGTAGIERMRITSNGNVGVGTINPLSKLHVKGVGNDVEVRDGSGVLITPILTGTGGWARWFGILNNTVPYNSSEPINHISMGTFLSLTNGVENTNNTFSYLGKSWDKTFMTFRPNGNIGIGTTNPENSENWDKVLQVTGNNHAKSIVSTVTNGVISGIWSHSTGYFGALAGGITGTSSNHPFSVITNKISRMTFTNTGNVGIGTTNPLSKLHVKGGVFSEDSTNEGGSISILNTLKTNLGYRWTLYNMTGQYGNSLQFFNYSKDYISYSIPMVIMDNGNVGIGTMNPDQKLTVKGKIHVEEVIANLNIPADYVFQKYYTGTSSLKSDYKMLSLEEIEKFTRENHHLPEIPSAKEIQENGIYLAQMNNLLLQKIEELTLHTIEVNKKNETQEKLLEKLSQRLLELEQKISK